MRMVRVTADFTRLTGNKSVRVEILASDITDICKTLVGVIQAKYLIPECQIELF